MSLSTPAILRTIAELRGAVASWRRAGESVGLVPTMGALHEGHLSLVRAAQRSCRRVVVSIFVNPTQFGPNSDFARYPRDLAGDVAKLATVGADAAFAPEVMEMYPPDAATTVTVGALTEGLCGPHRPGHFAGVATIVTKLLNQAGADAAFFGEKDYQQLQVIRRLARDLDIATRIEGVPTVREPDGLAMSSRNLYLTPAERAQAPLLHRVLAETARDFAAGAPAAALVPRATAALLGGGFRAVDYVAIVDADSLALMARIAGPARIAAAAWLGHTRLIDNVPVVSASATASGFRS